MVRYADEYERRYGRQGGRFGRGRGGVPGRDGYDFEFRRAARGRRLPRKPAHGFPVRGYHTYDLDYGATGGPTTEYSGRTGYPVLPSRPDLPDELPHRGPYTPTLEEEDRGRTLYGGVPPGYREREGRRPRWRQRRDRG